MVTAGKEFVFSTCILQIGFDVMLLLGCVKPNLLLAKGIRIPTAGKAAAFSSLLAHDVWTLDG